MDESGSRWECCRRLQSERGLKIHQAKLNAKVEVEKQRAGAAVHSGKTPNDTGPHSHHSSECVRVSGLTEDLPRARIKLLIVLQKNLLNNPGNKNTCLVIVNLMNF